MPDYQQRMARYAEDPLDHQALDFAPPRAGRWWQLAFGVVSMMLIANLQYGWTLFVAPMQQARGWSGADIQIAFSVFVALETWFTPAAGWLVDRLGPRRGPRLVVAAGGILVAAGWVINAAADSLTLLYVGAVVSGLGAGAVYAVCVSNAVRWFPDRRGLAVGLTAAGFGAGAAATVVPIRAMILSQGYAATFFWFGIGQGASLFALAWMLRGPAADEIARAATSNPRQSRVSARPAQCSPAQYSGSSTRCLFWSPAAG